MTVDDFLDLVEAIALFGVLAVLSYLVYLLKVQLSDGVAALHAIVKAQDDMQARLNVLERERER